MSLVGCAKTDMLVKPVASFENLRERIGRLLARPGRISAKNKQLPLELISTYSADESTYSPKANIVHLLDFLTHSIPNGDIYLFGGLLRDVAFYGKRGFNSDLDLVVDGRWQHCLPYLESLGAQKNKFGGYRLKVAGWPIDIWSAEKTWAFEQGLMPYKGITSLTKTTILNWDAILMNWRTKQFVCGERYLHDINARCLDIVFEENPNPIGMAVRVLRHLCSKDPLQITPKAANYIAGCVNRYSLDELRASELKSYRKVLIDEYSFRLFERVNSSKCSDIGSRYRAASESFKKDFAIRKLL